MSCTVPEAKGDALHLRFHHMRLLFLLVALAVAALGEDALEFRRGPERRGIYSGAGVPRFSGVK